MSSNRLKTLRILLGVLLILLLVQYEFGMAVNSSNPPSLPAFSLSDNSAFNNALNAAGGLALAHSVLGFVVWLLALWNLVVATRTRVRSVQILGWLAFLGITVAGVGGTLFVASGFNDDRASLLMASTFILSYSFVFLELYFLKGDPGATRTT